MPSSVFHLLTCSVLCSGPNSYFDINAVDKEVVKATTTSLASVLTNVSVSTDGECSVSVKVNTSVTPAPQQIVPSNTSHDEHPAHAPSAPDKSTLHSPSPGALSDAHEGSSDQHPPTTHPASTLKPTPHPKTSSPSAKRGKHASHPKPSRSTRTRPPPKTLNKQRRSHGSVSHNKFSSHQHQAKANVPKSVKRKPVKKGRHHNRLVRKPKKMLKYIALRDRKRQERGMTMKVRPLIHRIRAAQKLLAKRKAERARHATSKSRQHRQSTASVQGRSRVNPRRRTRLPRRSRRPRQSRRTRGRQPRHV